MYTRRSHGRPKGKGQGREEKPNGNLHKEAWRNWAKLREGRRSGDCMSSIALLFLCMWSAFSSWWLLLLCCLWFVNFSCLISDSIWLILGSSWGKAFCAAAAHFHGSLCTFFFEMFLLSDRVKRPIARMCSRINGFPCSGRKNAKDKSQAGAEQKQLVVSPLPRNLKVRADLWLPSQSYDHLK